MKCCHLRQKGLTSGGNERASREYEQGHNHQTPFGDSGDRIGIDLARRKAEIGIVRVPVVALFTRIDCPVTAFRFAAKHVRRPQRIPAAQASRNAPTTAVPPLTETDRPNKSLVAASEAVGFCCSLHWASVCAAPSVRTNATNAHRKPQCTRAP